MFRLTIIHPYTYNVVWCLGPSGCTKGQVYGVQIMRELQTQAGEMHGAC